jgi:hypothetical protein
MGEFWRAGHDDGGSLPCAVGEQEGVLLGYPCSMVGGGDLAGRDPGLVASAASALVAAG